MRKAEDMQGVALLAISNFIHPISSRWHVPIFVPFKQSCILFPRLNYGNPFCHFTGIRYCSKTVFVSVVWCYKKLILGTSSMICENGSFL